MSTHHRAARTYNAMVTMCQHCVQVPNAVGGFATSSVNRDWVRNVALEAAKDVLKSVAFLGEPITVYRTVAGIKFSNGAEIRLI